MTTVTINVPETVHAGGNVLDAGTYTVELPEDYDPALVTGEDILMDGSIRIVADSNPEAILTISEIHERLEAADVSASDFWAQAGGGDRTPLTSDDVARVVAILDLDATEHEGSYRFEDDHGQTIEVDAPDLERYGRALLDGTADYSVWCSETSYDVIGTQVTDAQHAARRDVIDYLGDAADLSAETIANIRDELEE